MIQNWRLRNKDLEFFMKMEGISLLSGDTSSLFLFISPADCTGAVRISNCIPNLDERLRTNILGRPNSRVIALRDCGRNLGASLRKGQGL